MEEKNIEALRNKYLKKKYKEIHPGSEVRIVTKAPHRPICIVEKIFPGGLAILRGRDNPTYFASVSILFLEEVEPSCQ